ncbi:MAG: hypothetical protein IT383_15310 [Deltaproteobacteria bacterium]|nr:hypothetical protein [Deltaproteobacteria bacterium]
MVKLCEDAFPFVISVVSGEITDADVDEMRHRYALLHQRKRRFFLAQEARQVSIPSAAMRRRLAELNSEFRELIRQHIIGIDIVVPSRVVSAAMTAVYWVSKEAAPTRFFPSAAAMAAHARQVCAAEQVMLPPAVDDVARVLDDAWRDGRRLIDVDLGSCRPVQAA